MRPNGIAMLIGCENPARPGKAQDASFTNEPGNESAPAPPTRNWPSSFNPNSLATSVSTMPTLSPVSNTNESGRESLILTLTTMGGVTSSKGIVTGAVVADGAGVCATPSGALTRIRERNTRVSKFLRFIGCLDRLRPSDLIHLNAPGGMKFHKIRKRCASG